jgi:hypothetical protein
MTEIRVKSDKLERMVNAEYIRGLSDEDLHFLLEQVTTEAIRRQRKEEDDLH